MQPVIGWAWRASAQVDQGWKLRSKFVLAALQNASLARSLEHLDGKSPLGRLIAERPETSGNLIWPQQCADREAETRFIRIPGHFESLENLPGRKSAGEEQPVLADLSSLSA